MNIRKTFLVISLSLFGVAGRAQQSASAESSKATAIPLFFEKTYLHTDRTYYSTGENLWFSAYLVNGKSNNLTASSNSLYVELISGSKIIDAEVVRLENGIGKGDFKLKDSIPGGWYQLRAYTNWMRNFGDSFVFQKSIYITSALPLKTRLKVKSEEPAGPVNIVTAATENIYFFPEGGSLVEGLNGLVAFKVVDGNGNGIKAVGKVVSAKGDTISSFESTDLGMGIFMVKPVAGLKYHVEGVYANQHKFNSNLPDVLSKGMSIHVLSDSLNIKAVISINELLLPELENKEIAIAVRHGGEIFYSGNVKINKAQIAVSVPLQDLPPGIAGITVYDDKGRPNCERLVYVPDANPVSLSISTNQDSYQPKEKVVLTIKAKDLMGKPVKTAFSMAVVDGIVPSDKNSIVSYLMLESEIRGKIQDAGRYFDPENQGRLRQLDLLLLSQGWRDFIWKRMADTSINISYMPEPGITLSGRVREKVANKPLANMNITLFGNGFRGDKIYLTKTNNEGKYFLDGLNWYGNQSIKLSSKDDKGKKGGWLLLDSLFDNPMKINALTKPKADIPDLSAFRTESIARMAYNRSVDTIKLKEVVIAGGDKKVLKLRDETLFSFGYPDLVYNITPEDYDYKSLEHFLLTKVPGAQLLSDTTDGVAFMAGGKKIAPRFIINNKEDIFERLDYYSLGMDQVNQIVVRHMLRNGTEDAYVISLNLKDTAFGPKAMNILNLNVTGYYQARTFYAPSGPVEGKRDLRTTIFWNPALSTNENGEAIVSFFSTDAKASVSVRAEGISDKNRPVCGTVVYKVQ